MTSPARGMRNEEDALHAEDPEFSRASHEQSAFLGPASDSRGQVDFPLSEEEEEEDHAREVLSWKSLPWWRRPSPYWLVFSTFFSCIGFAALLAPKVSMYTALACRVHRPDYVINNRSLLSAFPLTHNLGSSAAVGTPVPRLYSGSEIPALFLNSLYTPSSGYTPSELDPLQKCASDPVVQAVVTRLNAVFSTSAGILSCLTGGWWASLSDCYGRRIVLFISVFGLLVTEFNHVITAWFMDVLPGGYWFLLVGFLIEGLLGGMAGGVATNHAYLADTTNPSTRSRYFSLSLGLVYIGVAIGPALGGLIIRSTGNLLSVFYFATFLHSMYAVFLLLFLPESVTRARVRGARLRRKQEKADQPPGSRARDALKTVPGLLKPLLILLPEKPLDINRHKPKSSDWSLLFLAIAYALFTSGVGAFAYKLQYAAAQFNWTPEITSYYVSVTGAARAIFLAAILPLFLKYFKPTRVQLPSTPDEPLRGSISPSPAPGASSLPGTTPNKDSERQLPVSRSPVFDLMLARLSALAEVATCLGMAVASTGTLFTLASTVHSFSVGFSPATQALALDIYANRSRDRGEVGKLFGALSIIQALGSQIISPALYGLVYASTVTRFPQAIMIVSMCVSFLAFVSLSFVRVSSKPGGDHVTPENSNEQGSEGTVPEVLLTTESGVVEERG